MELAILTQKPVDLEIILDVSVRTKNLITMIVEILAITLGTHAMVPVQMVPNHAEQDVFKMMRLILIGNAGKIVFVPVKHVMKHVPRDGTSVEMTHVFFQKKRNTIMTVMESATISMNPVMEHVLWMAMLHVIIGVLMRTVQVSMKTIVFAMERVKVNVTLVMMEVVLMVGRLVETTDV